MEAKAFSARLADFRDLGAGVAGISHDNIETLKDFQARMPAGQRFISDAGKSISAAYRAELRVFTFSMVKRITYVISRQGTILHRVDDLNPLTNVNAVHHWLKDHPQA